MRALLSTIAVTTLITSTSFAQGLLKQASSEDQISCGSHHLMQKMDQEAPGFQQQSDQMLEEIQQRESHAKGTKTEEVHIIPVVFHVVYENEVENVPDSVIMNQLRVMNECFRRTNADTSSMRSDFDGLVGDARIEFVMAQKDPKGNTTNGITRTETTVGHFGGILPHGQGENAKILQWINDSLFDNYFRITEQSKGGADAWDPTRYLNIWIGDMRIFEPKFNNFEEIYLLALATPPLDHKNWNDESFQSLRKYHQGVLMHYLAAGPNNPAQFPSPYQVFNGNANLGKLLVHEVGHYLGLRHIWGDGDCTADDFIDDTPRASGSSLYKCDQNANSCKDTINGKDLPNMIENYMDYSDGKCQNSFTNGQVALMRGVIKDYRSPLVSVQPKLNLEGIVLYPNPTSGSIHMILPKSISNFTYVIRNAQGQIVGNGASLNNGVVAIPLQETPGIYFIEVQSGAYTMIRKVVRL